MWLFFTAVEIVEEDSNVELVEDMVEQVLAMQVEPDSLELVSVEQALVTQASHLLEETDINTVLSTIQADEFNDLFTGRNYFFKYFEKLMVFVEFFCLFLSRIFCWMVFFYINEMLFKNVYYFQMDSDLLHLL